MKDYIIPKVSITQTKKYPEIFEFVEAKSLWYPIYYILDSGLRKSVNLQNWFQNIVSNPCDELIKIANTIKDNDNPDYTVTDILHWVNKNITYVQDNVKWKLAERWQTPEETLSLRTGDCEDGAILIAALVHYKKVPSNRWLINCGDVVGGGHAYFSYKPSEYPLNWCFMDWCYYYDGAVPEDRTKYYIKDATIYGDAQYQKLWFAFNDKKSYKGLLNIVN